MPSWLRRISAGFTTSTVPLTVSIIAPPASRFLDAETRINGEYHPDYNTEFSVFILVEKKGFAPALGLPSVKSSRKQRRSRPKTSWPPWLRERLLPRKPRYPPRPCAPLFPWHEEFRRACRNEPKPESRPW